MFSLLARVAHRGRWPIMILSIVMTIGASVWGPGIFKEVTTAGSFVVVGSESQKTADELSRRFPATDYDVIAVIGSTSGADPTQLRSAVDSYTSHLDRSAVSGIATPWGPARPGDARNPQLSADGTQAVVLMTLAGKDAQTRNDDFVTISAESNVPSGFQVGYAGPVPTEQAIGAQTKKDITLAETVSMPLLGVLLIIVFGSLTSSLLPVLMGGAATVGAFAILRVIAGHTEVSIFAITISSILSLVLAVDYGLFIVSRYRQELAQGKTGLPALVSTMRTAGETVSVSGLLVLVSLGVLLLFPQNFLKSMAYGGLSTVAIALVFALVVLPAFLAVLGPRIDSLRVPWRRSQGQNPRSGMLHRLSHRVMRRPTVFVVVVLAVLAPLVAPALQLRLGSVDQRVLPPDHAVAVASQTLQDDFPAIDLQPVKILITGEDAPDRGYLDAVAAVPGVDDVAVLGVKPDHVQVQARLRDDWQSDEAVQAVKDIRGLTPPPGATTMVGGMTAEMVDQTQAVRDEAPRALGLLVVAMFVLLGLAFRSILLPLKAIAMNLLSVGAAFGIMVWIFQEGHLSDVLGFTATGTLDPSNLILIFALLFGLLMDYEVFMLSRVKEEFYATGDNRHAVATGLQATGGIITAAAGLLLIVVGAFSFSGISFIKMIGIGMLTAITIDVVLIRGLLVPATMRLLGRLNWWPGYRAGITG